MHGIGKPRARGQRALGCAGPVALRLLQLRSVHQTLAAERHQDPVVRHTNAQRRGPFGGAAQIEKGHALKDHRAVSDARRDRIEFISRRRHHDLIELGHARIRLTECDQGLSVTQRSERVQIGVVELVTDVGGTDAQFPGASRIARFQCGEPPRDEQVARSSALDAGPRDQRLAAGKPAVGPRRLTARQQQKTQPERVASRLGPARPAVSAARCAASHCLTHSSSAPSRNARIAAVSHSHASDDDVIAPVSATGPLRRPLLGERHRALPWRRWT